MNNRVYIVATNLETGNIVQFNNTQIIYSGIGKINATIATMKAFVLGYNEVINIGSCGSLKLNKNEIVDVGNVYQDIDLSPICGYGVTPYDKCPSDMKISDSGKKCFTTDYFYDFTQQNKYSKHYIQMVNECDIFDMECFAIAKVCYIHRMSFRSFKWVSDNGGDVSWEDNCRIGFKKLEEYIVDNKI